jgi:hypothetical protein
LAFSLRKPYLEARLSVLGGTTNGFYPGCTACRWNGLLIIYGATV